MKGKEEKKTKTKTLKREQKDVSRTDESKREEGKTLDDRKINLEAIGAWQRIGKQLLRTHTTLCSLHYTRKTMYKVIFLYSGHTLAEKQQFRIKS